VAVTSILLVLRALGLGDLLAGVPAYRALARHFPGHRRVLAAPAALAPLAVGAGLFDAVAPAARLGAPARLPRRPDVAVNLHGKGPESHRMLLATAPGRLVAFAHPAVPETAGAPRWSASEHEVVRWCRLLEESGIAADPADLALPTPRAPRLAPAAGATILHPGAASEARRWPAPRWAAIARAESARGRRVLVTGSAAERRRAIEVAALAELPDDAVLAGRTDLDELAALVGVAGRIVCGDTGLAHLATALGTPSVVLFGPTDPAHWGPPAERPQHRVLWAGGTGDPHAPDVDSGLLAITADDVLAALRDLPARPHPAWTAVA
jgi:ADP-heptose:LPS heptosyltransferase